MNKLKYRLLRCTLSLAVLLLTPRAIASAQAPASPESPAADVANAPVPVLGVPLSPAQTVPLPAPAVPSGTSAAGAGNGAGIEPVRLPQPPPPSASDQPSFAAAAGKGLLATSADKRFQIGFRPRVQLRETLQKDQTQTQNELQVKTLRLTIAGYALSPDLKYLIQFAFGAGDFDTGNSSPIFDAFVEYTAIRDFNVRVGQFFVPFDRARTIREFALQFVDRQGVVRELTLDRDVGVMFSSQDLFGLGGRLAYHAFVGGGDGRNRIADTKNKYGPQTPGVLVVGRLIARPFGQFDDDQEGDVTRSPTPHLALGVAGAYNISSDRDKSTFGNTYTLGTFNYAHAAADLVFKWHGFSLLTEALYREANKTQHTGVVDGKTVTERSRSGYGYFAQVGQMLTSQLELTARAETMKGTNHAQGRALKDVVRVSGRQIGGGLNLYLNGHAFKLQSDYFYVFGSNDFTKGAHVARLQVDATF